MKMDGYKTYVGLAGVLLVGIAANYLKVDMTDVNSQAANLLNLGDQIFATLIKFGLVHKAVKMFPANKA